MPIFEYRCNDCKTNFEKIVLSSSTPSECPNCNSNRVEKLLSTFAVGGRSTSTTSVPHERACGRGNFT
ncbi:MAG: zinc ribbon domain-containing protein [Acidobacteria bacterium]|nr:zinc ribbon domain-containing protein [Acidobacteriota bacterium]MCZ6769549.1 zinc ribbon domain-containing protein [Acidobacteriota bacterium]MCZ6877344.1 zinc ribbon domain-containing protein [Acidobacteriota bacterium]